MVLFSMTKQGCSPSISVYNNNQQVLKNIMPITGGGLHQNFRKEWHLRIGKISDCKALCEKLLPRLITKKRQAELLLKACNLEKSDRSPIGDELSAINRTKEYKRPPDSVSMKIDTTKDASEWSYFGGYVDTDANIEFNAQIRGLTTYYYPHFNIYCKNPDPLIWLQKRFGGQFKSRKRDGKWISSLEFEDQCHVLKMLEVLRPYVLDKKEAIDVIIEACKRDSKDRAQACAKLREINERFHGLHKFTKTADGKYIDGKRSEVKPHRTHKGVPLSRERVEVMGNAESVMVKSSDGTVTEMTRQELRDMKHHFDQKYLKEDFYENIGDHENARSLVTRKKFIETREGWSQKSPEEIEQILVNDWSDAMNALKEVQDKENEDDADSGYAVVA